MKLDRLLGITMELLTQKKVTAPELAEKFEVSVRTIYRDMDAIGLAGIPVMASLGSTGGFELMPGYFLTKQHFSLEELSLIYQFFKAMGDASAPEAVQSITQKLATLRPNLAETSHIIFEKQAPLDESKWLTIIHQSIVQSHALLLSYIDFQNQKTHREVIPYHLIWEKGHWYLEAYCLLRQAKRYFRISRIDILSMSEKTYTAKPDLMDEDFDCSHTILTVLEFDLSVKQSVKEQFPDEWEETKDSILVKTSFYNADYALKVILSYGNQVILISPESLRTDLVNLIQSIQEKYEEENK